MAKPERSQNLSGFNPSMREEKYLQSLGYESITGIDEAGRGPLAGPVVAGAAILPIDLEDKWLTIIRDSKQLTSRKRIMALDELRKFAIIATGQSTPEEIDKYGIVNAVNLAIKRVYKELNKKNKFWFKKKQRARFKCVLSIYWPNNKFVSVKGQVEGSISRTKKGNNGFGYDPIFIPKNYKITFGQMKPSKKYKIDHRFKAFKKIKKFF